MKRLYDLGFIIGSFFIVIGSLLVIYGVSSNETDAAGINTWCGGLFFLFGVMMMLLSIKRNKK